MKTFEKKYQLWVRDGETAAFVPHEFDTLSECITTDKQGDWYITKGVSLVVQEEGEAIRSVEVIHNEPSHVETTSRADEGEDLTPEQAAYLHGTGIATLT